MTKCAINGCTGTDAKTGHVGGQAVTLCVDHDRAFFASPELEYMLINPPSMVQLLWHSFIARVSGAAGVTA